jgi:hypothetical protein
LQKIVTLIAAAGVLALCAAPTIAAPKKNTPGHLMQQRGSVPGHPGASGYAPGHVKKMNRAGYNARAFAPGRRTYRLR